MKTLKLFLAFGLSAMLNCACAFGVAVNATKTGAVGDGATLNIIAIQRAIDDCSTGGLFAGFGIRVRADEAVRAYAGQDPAATCPNSLKNRVAIFSATLESWSK